MRGWIPLLFNYRFMTTKRDIDLRRKHLTILRWRHNQEILSNLADKYEQGRRAALLWHNREKRRAWDALKEFSAGEGARIRHLAKRALSHWRRCAAGRQFAYTAVRASVRVSFTLRSLKLLFRQASSKG